MIDFNNPDLHDEITITKSFKDIKLERFYVQSLESIGFVQPTPVQYYSISAGIQNTNNNLIVQSKSGTGKTLAYASICLHKIFNQGLSTQKMPSVLILQPTRELAVQVYQNFRKILVSGNNIPLSKQKTRQKQIKTIMSKIDIYLSIGGLPLQDDKKRYLQQGCHISVGTVGRIYQLVHNNIIKLDKIQTVIFDEGDKLFQQPDNIKKINQILSRTKSPQFLIYSATYRNTTIELIKRLGQFKFIRTIASQSKMKVEQVSNVNILQKNYEEVDLQLNNITKLCVKIQANNKSVFSQKCSIVKQMLDNLLFQKCLIFVEKKTQIPQVFQALKSFNPLLIHGSLSQSTRIKLMNQMNSNKIIITSDLLARGIDIVVDLIILFNSNQGDNFWHRIGRTGRIGRKGVVISLDYFQNWQQYTQQLANKHLKQCSFVASKQVFGEYMTQLGKWIQVDQEMQFKNLNQYKYFDQQQFQRQMQATLNMQLQAQVQNIQQDLIPVFDQQQNEIDFIQNQEQLQQYLTKLLNCECCFNNLHEVHKLTGYQFGIFNFVSNKQ